MSKQLLFTKEHFASLPKNQILSMSNGEEFQVMDDPLPHFFGTDQIIRQLRLKNRRTSDLIAFEEERTGEAYLIDIEIHTVIIYLKNVEVYVLS